LKLLDLMDETFVLLPALWSVERALRFLDGHTWTHIVIRRELPERTYHYLFPRREVRDACADADPDATLTAVFKLHEYTSTEERDPGSEADTAPDRVVLLEDGAVVGFFDATRLPQPRAYEASRRGLRKEWEESFVEGLQEPFEAYPALSMPETAPSVETEFDIFVGFREQADPRLTEGGPIVIPNPDPSKNCLVVLVGDGVRLDRESDKLPLSKNAQLRFSGWLLAGVQQASVKVLYFYDNQLIGTAKRCIQLSGAAAARSAGPEPANPCRVEMPASEAYVDLTVSLTYMQDGTLEWRFTAPAADSGILTHRSSERLPESKEFAAELLRDLKTQGHRGAWARNVLDNIGQDIAFFIPPQLFQLLRDVHAALQRTPTLLFLTNEVFVPWELAYMDQPLDPNAPPFLAAQTQMGRWLEDSGVMLPPAVTLEVKRITAVASRYGLSTGQRELKEALAEQRTLGEKWRAVQLEAVKADMEAMVTGAKIPGHLVHFAVHGYSDPNANNQVLLLADGTQMPARALTGAYTCGQTPRFSFVFLNACQVGSPGRTLGHAGGFPGILVRRGALGFIAPLWEVDDDLARVHAETFYCETLERKQPVGAVLHAQRATYKEESTTPMAYIYYGHPALRLQFDANQEGM
jgi:hypothetical protein